MFAPIPPAPEPTKEQAAQQAAEQQLDNAYVLATQLLDQGKKPGEVIRILQVEGHAPETAAPLVHEVLRNRGLDSQTGELRQLLRDAGQKNMLIGGLVCLAGTGITLATLSAAMGPGGGSYVIAWGAIVFGAIQFLRGLGQVSKANR